jgi:hypothetical protein
MTSPPSLGLPANAAAESASSPADYSRNGVRARCCWFRALLGGRCLEGPSQKRGSVEKNMEKEGERAMAGEESWASSVWGSRR